MFWLFRNNCEHLHLLTSIVLWKIENNIALICFSLKAVMIVFFLNSNLAFILDLVTMRIISVSMVNFLCFHCAVFTVKRLTDWCYPQRCHEKLIRNQNIDLSVFIGGGWTALHLHLNTHKPFPIPGKLSKYHLSHVCTSGFLTAQSWVTWTPCVQQ